MHGRPEDRQDLYEEPFFPKALRAKGFRLVVWGSGGRGRGTPWGGLGAADA